MRLLVVSLLLLGIAGGLVGGCTSPAAERAARVAAQDALEAGPAAERLAGVVQGLAVDPPAGRRLPSRLLLAWAADLDSQAGALRSAAGSLGGARAAGLSAADRAAGLAAGLRSAVAAGDAAALPALAADWSAACDRLAELIR